MARLLLDSTVLIDALRGRAAADSLRRARRNGDEPWVCAISVEEIWRGLREEEVAAAAARLFRGLRSRRWESAKESGPGHGGESSRLAG